VVTAIRRELAIEDRSFNEAHEAHEAAKLKLAELLIAAEAKPGT
jgi:hypothetical protein